jgi:hypothetical protein
MSRSTTGWASPPAGRPSRLSDAELLTLAVAQVLLGVRSEARWLQFVPRALPAAFPYLPGQSGYNKRLRAAVPLIKHLTRVLAVDADLWSDPGWVVDSTPVECARSRPTVQRSNLAAWAKAAREARPAVARGRLSSDVAPLVRTGDGVRGRSVRCRRSLRWRLNRSSPVMAGHRSNDGDSAVV